MRRNDKRKLRSRRVADGRSGTVVPLRSEPECEAILTVCGEQEDVRARRVHLVTLTRMESLLLHGFDLKRFKLLVEDLTLKSHSS